MNNEAGKGSQYRPQTREEKRNYDRNYLRIHGIKCSTCRGTGVNHPLGDCDNFGCGTWTCPECVCKTCDGLGYIEKPKEKE